MSFAEVRAIPAALRPRSRQAEMTGSDLQLASRDLEGPGPYESELIDLRGHFVYTLYSEVDDVAATVGDFSVFVDIYDREAEVVVESIEIFAAQSAASDNTLKVVFGEGVDTALEDAAGVSGATLGARVANAKLNFLVKFRLVVDNAADAASTASLAN